MKDQDDKSEKSKLKILKRTDYLSDLDGLLVNSKNFNKLFIQRTSNEWIKTQVEKIVESRIHLSKFIEVLTNFVVSENHHPHVVQQVLVWLSYFTENHSTSLQTPEIQQSLRNLCSYCYETCTLAKMYVEAANRGNAVENWSNGQKYTGYLPRRFYYTILPKTSFVYIDDENIVKKRKVLPAKRNSIDIKDDFTIPDNDDNDELMDLDSVSSMIENESEYEQESLYESLGESDGGVFDVNEPLSSDAEHHHHHHHQQQQRRFPFVPEDEWGEQDQADLFEAESDSDDFQYPDVDNDCPDNISVSSTASSTSSKQSLSLFPDVNVNVECTSARQDDSTGEKEGKEDPSESMMSSDSESTNENSKTKNKSKKKPLRKSNKLESVSNESPDNRRKSLRSSRKKTTPKK